MFRIRTTLTSSALTLFAGSALAGITTYGTGCPDSGLTAPTLSLAGQDFPGGFITMSFDGAASGSFILIMMGLGQSAIPMGFDCTLNVAPLLPAPIGPLPLDANGNIAFSTVLPDTIPAPFTITLQAFEADPLVAGGFASSNGIQLGFVPPAPVANHLVINEIDYTWGGINDQEFVEIYNPTDSAIFLDDIRCVFVQDISHGHGPAFFEYASIDISGYGVLGPHQYLVIRDSTVSVPSHSAIKVNFSGSPHADNIRNGFPGQGPQPGAVLLVNTVTGECIDAASYEGSSGSGIAAGVFCSSFELFPSLLADHPYDPSKTFQRWPNGYDSNNNAVDFVNSAYPSPGEFNWQP